MLAARRGVPGTGKAAANAVQRASAPVVSWRSAHRGWPRAALQFCSDSRARHDFKLTHYRAGGGRRARTRPCRSPSEQARRELEGVSWTGNARDTNARQDDGKGHLAPVKVL